MHTFTCTNRKRERERETKRNEMKTKRTEKHTEKSKSWPPQILNSIFHSPIFREDSEPEKSSVVPRQFRLKCCAAVDYTKRRIKSSHIKFVEFSLANFFTLQKIGKYIQMEMKKKKNIQIRFDKSELVWLWFDQNDVKHFQCGSSQPVELACAHAHFKLNTDICRIWTARIVKCIEFGIICA